MKTGILVVSFGTTHRETEERNIGELVKAVRNAHPDCEVLQAYSSGIVRRILYERDGIIIPDISQALMKMKENGTERAVILPTHVIDGVENHKLKQLAGEREDWFLSVRMAGALLEKEADYPAVAKALWDAVKEEAGGRIPVLMGHGTSHEADGSYEKMERALREYTGREIYIATVEGRITIEDVIRRMRKVKRREASGQPTGVLLLPFMLVAGEHAVNDMAGEGSSFAGRMRAEGYETKCLLKGLGEYEKIRRIYLRHLQEAMEEGKDIR